MMDIKPGPNFIYFISVRTFNMLLPLVHPKFGVTEPNESDQTGGKQVYGGCGGVWYDFHLIIIQNKCGSAKNSELSCVEAH